MQRRFGIAFWIVVAVAVVLLWSGSLSVPLMDPDESRFARTSVEMLRNRDLVVPRFDGEPRLVKPPMVHWIQTAFFGTLGVAEWTARLHAGLATLGTILLLGNVARRRFGEEGALWAAATLATMPLVIVVGRLGTLDALLAVHVLAAIAIDLAEPRGTGTYRGLAAGGVLGLAFLIKGPVGVVLPLVIVLCGRTATRRDVLPSWRGLFQGVAGIAIVVLPWGLALVRRIGLDQVVQLLRTEALERYFAGTFHIRPPWFYLPVLLVGCSPWIVPLVLGLVRAIRMRRDPAARTALYAGAGFVGGLIFFSLGRGKLPNYLLPLMPLAALVVAWEFGQQLRRTGRLFAGPALLAATPGVIGLALFALSRSGLDGLSGRVALAGAAIHATGFLACLPALARRRPREVFGLVAGTAAIFLAVAMTLLPAELARERSAARLIEVVPELRSSRPLVVVEMKVPSLSWYLDRSPEYLGHDELLERLDGTDDPLFVFADVDLPDVPAGALGRLRELGRQAKFVVFEKTGPTDAGCP